MTDELEPTRVYPAGSLVVEWRQPLCQHSARCLKANPRVFNPRRQPWVQPEHATEAELEAAVAQCPSGALRIRRVAEG